MDVNDYQLNEIVDCIKDTCEDGHGGTSPFFRFIQKVKKSTQEEKDQYMRAAIEITRSANAVADACNQTKWIEGFGKPESD